MNANHAYLTKKAEIAKQLEKLNQLLAHHAATQAQNSTHYTYAGDLAYVEEQLQIAIDFLAGEEGAE